MKKAIQKFPRGSAAGGSGLSPNHLLELTRAPGADTENGLLKAMAAGLDVFARGDAPPKLAEWVAGAPLTALRKSDGGVRPIAVGETIRRLVSSLLLARCTERVREILVPTQLGVAVPMGVEAIVHAVRHVTEKHKTDNQYGLLQIDLKNAFNLVSRAAFRKQIRLQLPQLAPWVDYCYGKDRQPHLWVGNISLRSACGVQQGDPLGPLLFAMALQPTLLKLRHRIEAWKQELGIETNDGAPSTLAFYLDDGVIIERHEILQRVLKFFEGDDAIERGLHLCLQKCTVWWPNIPDNDITNAYPNTKQQIRGIGLPILQSPIGSHRYMIEMTMKKAEELQPLFRDILDLNDAHTSFALLRA